MESVKWEEKRSPTRSLPPEPERPLAARWETWLATGRFPWLSDSLLMGCCRALRRSGARG